MQGLDVSVVVVQGLIFLIGSALGSFLAATAYRLPRNISLLRPSQCVSCDAAVPWWGLVPIFGYFFLRGKCVNCGQRFSPHYAFFEFLMGALTLYCVEVHVGTDALLMQFTNLWGVGSQKLYGAFHFVYVVPLLTSLWLLYSGGLLSLIDIEFRILPDVITLPGIVVGLIITAFDPERAFTEALIGVAVGGGGLWLVAAIYRLLRGKDGMGLGDVKYLAMVGAVLGWTGVLWCLLIASFLGSIAGLFAGLISKKGLQTAIPFGPFLAAGALVYSLHQLFFLDWLYGPESLGGAG